MNTRVHNRDLFVTLGRMRGRESSALEAAATTLPDLSCVIHTRGLYVQGEALLLIFADAPSPLAKAPVVVCLASTAIHHLLGVRVCANGIGADAVAHASSRQNSLDRRRGAAVRRCDGRSDAGAVKAGDGAGCFWDGSCCMLGDCMVAGNEIGSALCTRWYARYRRPEMVLVPVLHTAVEIVVWCDGVLLMRGRKRSTCGVGWWLRIRSMLVYERVRRR